MTKLRDSKSIEYVNELLLEFDEVDIVEWTRKVKEFLEFNQIVLTHDIQVAFIETEDAHNVAAKSSAQEIKEFLEGLIPEKTGSII